MANDALITLHPHCNHALYVITVLLNQDIS